MPGVSNRETDPQSPRFRELGVNFAHLAALSAFAVAQPLFDVLDESADFFAAVERRAVTSCSSPWWSPSAPPRSASQLRRSPTLRPKRFCASSPPGAPSLH